MERRATGSWEGNEVGSEPSSEEWRPDFVLAVGGSSLSPSCNRPGISGVASLRGGVIGAERDAARDEESRDEGMTSYLNRSAKVF